MKKLLFILFFGFGVSLHAEVLFKDDFSYAVGSQINGQNGGAGYSSGWVTESEHNRAIISNHSLSYTFENSDTVYAAQSLHLLGGETQYADGYLYRSFSSEIRADNVYVSFLVMASPWLSPGGEWGSSYYQMALSKTSLPNQSIGWKGVVWQCFSGKCRGWACFVSGGDGVGYDLFHRRPLLQDRQSPFPERRTDL